MSLVLVTGANGFIASHIVDQLLAQKYEVVATVRSASKGESLVKNYKGKYPDAVISYEVVVEIGASDAFDNVWKKYSAKLKHVIHTASPAKLDLKGDIEEVYIKPAVNGVLNILKGVKDYAKGVETVVITSSINSVLHFQEMQSYVHTEDSWSDITREFAAGDGHRAYGLSKKLSEEAAWDFMKTEKPQFRLTTILPSFTAGPQVFASAFESGISAGGTPSMLLTLLDSKIDDEPAKFQMPLMVVIDVRDVAKAHILPLVTPKLANHRLFLVAENFSFQKALNYLNKNFPELRGKIAKGDPDSLAELDAKTLKYDNTKTLELTGFEPIPFEKTVVDAFGQALEYRKSH